MKLPSANVNVGITVKMIHATVLSCRHSYNTRLNKTHLNASNPSAVEFCKRMMYFAITYLTLPNSENTVTWQPAVTVIFLPASFAMYLFYWSGLDLRLRVTTCVIVLSRLWGKRKYLAKLLWISDVKQSILHQINNHDSLSQILSQNARFPAFAARAVRTAIIKLYLKMK